MIHSEFTRIFTLITGLLLFSSTLGYAQSQYGVGFELALAPPSSQFMEPFQLGFRMRLSQPINADVSFAGDLGFSSFLFRGRANALLALTPQFSLIITLPERAWAPYVLAGAGGYFPITGRGRWESGPTIHGGFGWVRPLRNSNFYIEINPMLIIGRTHTSVALPVRTGIIL